MLSWFFDEKPSPFKKKSKLVVTGDSDLRINCTPEHPHTASTITVTAIGPDGHLATTIQVEWSRFKEQSQLDRSEQKLLIAGRSYPCDTSDLGHYLRAHIKSEDGKTVDVVVGPIELEPTLRPVIEGALYSNDLLSQTTIVTNNTQILVNLRLNGRELTLVQHNSGHALKKNFSASEPKIEFSARMPNVVYLRFQQDKENAVKSWLEEMTGRYEMSMQDQSVVSTRIKHSPHSTNRAVKAGTILQSKYESCPNKVQLQFDNRFARDTFLMAHKAFVCRELLRISPVLTRIQTLTNLATEQDSQRFFEFAALKDQIDSLTHRLQVAEKDCLKKVHDLTEMEHSIAELNLMYLRILKEHGVDSRVIQNSIRQSRVSVVRDEMSKPSTKGDARHQPLYQENQNLRNAVKILQRELQAYRLIEPSQLDRSMQNTGHNSLNRNENANYPNNSMSLNTERGFEQLQARVVHLDSLNKQFTNENAKLMKERDHFRAIVQSYRSKEQTLNQSRVLDMSMLELTIKQKEVLQDEKNHLLKRIDTLAKENVKDTATKKEEYHVASRSAALEESLAAQTQRLSQLTIANFQLTQRNAKLQASLQAAERQIMALRRLLEEEQNKEQFLMIEGANGGQSNNEKLQKIKEQMQDEFSERLREQQDLTIKLGAVIDEKDKIIKQLREQMTLMKQSADSLNKSRDLICEVDQFTNEEFETLREENSILLNENERLSMLCEKYAKEVREAKKVK